MSCLTGGEEDGVFMKTSRKPTVQFMEYPKEAFND